MMKNKAFREWSGKSMLAASALFTVVVAAAIAAPPAFAYDATACTRKLCTGCAQPYEARACIGGLLPAGDCVCYTDFTLEFAQEVEMSASSLDTDCGGGRSGFFIIRLPSWAEAFAVDMGDPAFGWSGTTTLAAGTYRLEPSAQWGGNYCVDYWSGPPDCTGTLSPTSLSFGEVDSGECSSWETVGFENEGNMPFTIGGIVADDPAFEVDTAGMPATLDLDDDFDFRVRFCPPAGLASDTPYSGFVTVNYTCNSASNQRQLTVAGTGHVRRGELDVAASFFVGEADWAVPPGRVENSLRIDNDGDAPMTVTATLTDGGGGVFSLPSGGDVGTINGPSSRNLTIRATLTAEGTYTGSLRIDADYGGGFSGSRTVTLTARGHHPVPELFLHTAEIDYGEVERDYSFHQAVKVENRGDAELRFDIRLQDPADPDAGEFTLDLGSKVIPPGPGTSALYEMTFHPTSTGPREVFLVLDNTNEPAPTTHTVRLHGSGTDPIPLSTMLVIDRSGSMDAAAGDVRKIEAARDAGVLYTDLIRDAWDWLGVTRYNQGSSTPVPLAAVSANRADVLALLNDIGGALLPDGSTGIGGAMETASAELSGSPAANAQAMILLTDGKENEDPRIADVKPGILAAYPNLRIFAVGIGDPIETSPFALEGVEMSKLQAIAEDSDALFRVIREISGEDRYALEAFYFKAFAKATGRQLALDPMYTVPLSAGAFPIAGVEIVTCDRDADFLVLSELFRFPEIQDRIVLQDPTGQIITPAATVGGIAVHVKSGPYWRLFRIKFPERSRADAYAGTWRLLYQGVTETEAPAAASNRPAMQLPKQVPVAFLAGVGSDYRLEAQVTPGEVLVGQPLHITARTTEAWWPRPASAVNASITRPNGTQLVIALFDDGLHGDGEAGDATFGADFTGNLKGYYEILVRSQGTSERGENVVREEQLSKYVGKSLPDRPVDGACLPCWLLRLTLAAFLVLLLLILFWLAYCCRRMKRIAG